MVRIIAIVVSYNGARWIRRCLSSLISDDNVDLDVLLIDNCSQDDTVTIVKNEFPDAALVELDSNLGFGKANNTGFEFALENSYDHIFLLNQDAWFARGSIGDLVRLQQDHPEYGIISPIHLTGNGETLDSLFARYAHPLSCPGFYADAFLGKLKELYEAKFINAAAWLISRKFLSTVGGFDPIFPHYGEDSDYVFRGLRHSFKIGITPKVCVYHDRPQMINTNGAVDVYREYIARLVNLKRADLSTRFAVATTLKQTFDQISTFALCAEFRNSLKMARVLMKTLQALPRILASRRQMIQDACPYLNWHEQRSVASECEQDSCGKL